MDINKIAEVVKVLKTKCQEAEETLYNAELKQKKGIYIPKGATGPRVNLPSIKIGIMEIVVQVCAELKCSDDWSVVYSITEKYLKENSDVLTVQWFYNASYLRSVRKDKEHAEFEKSQAKDLAEKQMQESKDAIDNLEVILAYDASLMLKKVS